MKFRWISIWSDADDSEGIELEISDADVKNKSMSDKLEHIFRCCNSLDSLHLDSIPKSQQDMCGGDIVIMGDELFWCAPWSWCMIDSQKAFETYQATPRRDRHFIAPSFGEDGKLEKYRQHTMEEVG